MQLKPISEQVVVIVGASSGIGRETALEFAQKGAKIVISARSESGLTSLANEILASGGVVKVISSDVAYFERVKAIANFAIEQYGRIDT